MKLDVDRVSWTVEDARILAAASLACEPGTVAGLIGPNGAGKSSLLRCVYRVLRPDAGVVALDSRDVWSRNARQTAQQVGVVLQERPAETGFSVLEIVLMGRAPHKKLLDRDTAEDLQMARQALARVDLSPMADRLFDTLSGGEKQRVLVARALTQAPELLVVDEPTSHLDVRHQLDVLTLLRGLGITVIAALHDLNLAAQFCDTLFVLHEGRIVASGPPDAVLTPALIADVYGVRAEVGRHPLTNRAHVFFAAPVAEG